jgi:hypothetical protein
MRLSLLSLDSSRKCSEALSSVPKLELMLTLTKVCFAVVVVVYVLGCNRAVLIPESSPIRVGPDCQTKVYSLISAEWVLTDNKVVIPEGWYCVPPSFVEAQDGK